LRDVSQERRDHVDPDLQQHDDSKGCRDERKADDDLMKRAATAQKDIAWAIAASPQQPEHQRHENDRVNGRDQIDEACRKLPAGVERTDADLAEHTRNRELRGIVGTKQHFERRTSGRQGRFWRRRSRWR
jgi:hypothetical protein